MLPDTTAHLEAKGYLRGEHIDRVPMAEDVAGLLLTTPVMQDDLEEIQTKALIVSEIRHQLFGPSANEDVERELEEILGPLTGPRGKVQDTLEGEYVLCSASVTRRLSNNGQGAITVKKMGRFVTTNPDLTERYLWVPATSRLTKAMEATRELVDLGITRQPALAARARPAIAGAHEQMALILPVPQ